MVVKVTKEHIKNGFQKNPLCCPVALAFKQTFPTFFRVLFVADTIQFYNKQLDKVREIRLPERVVDFIVEFDKGKPVKPFSFKIKL